MKAYADLPALRTRQVLGDAAVALWVLLAVRTGLRVHELVSALGGPGRGLTDAGEGLASRSSGAGDTVGRAPVVGGALRDAFGGIAGAGTSLADAGRAQVEVADRLATSLGLLVALAGALVVLVPWLLHRVRWARRADEVRRLGSAEAGRDLLAARALALRPSRGAAARWPTTRPTAGGGGTPTSCPPWRPWSWPSAGLAPRARARASRVE